MMPPDKTPPHDGPDSLERLVQAHRAELDAFEPDPLLWQNIRRELDAQQTGSNAKPFRAHIFKLVPNVWQLAAAACVALLTYVAVHLSWLPTPSGAADDLAEMEMGPDLEALDPELAEADKYFTQLISQKRDQLKQAAGAKPKLVDEFIRDLDNLQATARQLRKELAHSPDPQQVASALIQNLRTQLEVLERQLSILESVNQVQQHTPSAHDL